MTLPIEVIERIKVIETRKQDKVVKAYLTWKNNKIVAVQCKLCSSDITGLIETDDENEIEYTKLKNTTIKKVPMTYAYFANYMEIKIQFDDKTYHVTNLCKNCLKSFITFEELEYVYLCDLFQFEVNSKIGLGSEIDWETLKDRIPDKITETSDAGII